MSSSDLPEGPLTTEDFLRNKPKSGSAPIGASQATIGTWNGLSLENSPNEQGILTTRQMLQVWATILIRPPLYFVIIILGLILCEQIGSDGRDAGAVLPIAVIGILAISTIANIRQVIDLVFGDAKVVKVEGIYYKETRGWGKNRRTVHTLGDTKI